MSKTELLNKTKRTFWNYFSDFGEQNWKLPALGITNIEFEFGDKSKDIFDYEITVTLERPGLLIGKGGRTIDELTEILTEQLKGRVKIYINESSLWKNLY